MVCTRKEEYYELPLYSLADVVVEASFTGPFGFGAAK